MVGSDLQPVLDITGHFATATMQQLNPKKSKAWVVGNEEEASLSLFGIELKETKQLRSLGAGFRFARGMRNEVGAKRIERGIQLAKRIQWAPLPMGIRAQLVASLACPMALYAYCARTLAQW